MIHIQEHQRIFLLRWMKKISAVHVTAIHTGNVYKIIADAQILKDWEAPIDVQFQCVCVWGGGRLFRGYK